MSDLPLFHGQDPLMLMADYASPSMIHRWIDALYETEFDNQDPRFVTQVYLVTALSEHIQTYPLNAEYQKKFKAICECVTSLVEELQEAQQGMHLM